jgi:hypothetical protein
MLLWHSSSKMADPWSLFALDPQTATEKDLKIAYAKLLKQNRPDVNPQGFRVIFDAYESALRTIRRGRQSAASGLIGPMPAPSRHKRPEKTPTEKNLAPGREGMRAGPTVGSSPDPQEARPPLPPRKPDDIPETSPRNRPITPDIDLKQNPRNHGEFLPPVAQSPAEPMADRLETALNDLKSLLRYWYFRWHLPVAFDDVMRAFEYHKTPHSARVAKWEDAFGGNMRLLADRMTNPPLLSLLKNDELSLCNQVTDLWFAHGRWKRLSDFGRALTGAWHGPFSPAVADYAASLALKTALADPNLADELASRTFETLGRHHRNELVSKIEPKIWMGKQLLLLPRGSRRLWIGRLARQSGLLDHRDMRMRRLVLTTIKKAPAGWKGWNLIFTHMNPTLESKTRRWIDWRAKGNPVEMMFLFDSRISAWIFRFLKLTVFTILAVHGTVIILVVFFSMLD